jgi:hypothetical protein
MLGGLSAGPGGWGCVVTVFVSYYSSRDKDAYRLSPHTMVRTMA